MENSEGRDFKIKGEKKKKQKPQEKKLLGAEESGCKLGQYWNSHCDKNLQEIDS